LETDDVRQLNIRPGDYVLISFTDTGIGMDAAKQLNIFDPFFTTKPGAIGLGLSQVYGFTRYAGGAVQVSSQPARGTQSLFIYRVFRSRILMRHRNKQRIHHGVYFGMKLSWLWTRRKPCENWLMTFLAHRI